MTLYICAPEAVTARRVAYCYSCRQRRRHIQRLFVWYDAEWCCCACGLSGDRTRSRRLRAEYAAKARSRWASALPYAEAFKLLMAKVDAQLGRSS